MMVSPSYLYLIWKNVSHVAQTPAVYAGMVTYYIIGIK